MFKKKIDPRNIILMLFSILFSLGILEVALRILFANNQTFLLDEHLDRSYLYETKYWKVWHYPNGQSKHSKDCFDVVYETNSLGLRGPEINENDTSKFRIALIGDSFIEGFGSSNHTTLPYFLDSLTGKDIEILNFGTSGGFGSVNQVAIYENFARHFNPDLTILFYLNYNDVHDNINSLSDGMINEELEFNYPVGTKEEVFNEIRSQVQPEPTSAVVSSFYVTSLANKGIRSLKLVMQSAINMKADFQGMLKDTYVSGPNGKLQIGYDIAEKSFEKLRNLTAKDSSDFLVINLSDPYQVDENWITGTELKYEVELDPIKPNKIIKGICRELEIAYYDMYPNAKTYIEENDLTFPYFSQTCDRHPSPMGHEYMANDIYQFLNKNNYLKPQ